MGEPFQMQSVAQERLRAPGLVGLKNLGRTWQITAKSGFPEGEPNAKDFISDPGCQVALWLF